MKNRITLTLAALALTWAAQAQQAAAPAGQTAFSLDQAVAYALQNSVTVKNAQTDLTSSKAKVGEIRAAGLPQLTGSLGYNYNAIVPKSVLESGRGAAALFGGTPAVNVPQGLPTGLGFALPHALTMGLQLNQLLFSPTYLIGLKAASVYTALYTKQAQKARIDVRAQVTKAYYQAMVGQEQAKLLDYNLSRIDTTLNNTRALFKNGFAENIDVYRLEVQRNNLMADKENTVRSIQLAISNLKFAMGYSIQQPLTITDNLEDSQIEMAVKPEAYGAYDQRIDYSILNTQEQLARLDLKSKQAGYLPTLVGFASLGANSAATRFIDMLPPYSNEFKTDIKGSGPQGKFQPIQAVDKNNNPIFNKTVDSRGDTMRTPQYAYFGGNRWYASSVIGVTLNVPIFDGFQKKYQIQQSKLALKKIADSRELVKNSIDFDVDRANIATANAKARLGTQDRNLALAKEVVRVTRIKYNQGVGSSLEVTNAETDLRVAQTNYYAALYDALVAKVDADVAAGRITAQ